MKKIFISFLLTIAVLCTTVIPVTAEETTPDISQNKEYSSIVYFEDGSVLEISAPHIVKISLAPLATAKTITASRAATYKDSDGVLQWKYTLTGTFSYTSGVSSTCTKASYTYNVYDSGWSFSDGAATKSGNKATGTGTFKFKVLFVTLKTYNINISLTCDTYGNVT